MRGHDIGAVTFRRQYPELLFPGTSQLDDGPPPPDQPLADQVMDPLNPRTWWRAARMVQGEVAVLMVWMPFFAPMLGVIARRLRRRGVAVLAVVHNATPHERRPGDRALTRWLLRACDGLLAMSDQVAADVRQLAPAVPLSVVPHPVYDGFGAPVPRADARARLGLPSEAPVFLFFGFIRRYKGLDVLLDAWPEVTHQVPRRPAGGRRRVLRR